MVHTLFAVDEMERASSGHLIGYVFKPAIDACALSTRSHGGITVNRFGSLEENNARIPPEAIPKGVR